MKHAIAANLIAAMIAITAYEKGWLSAHYDWAEFKCGRATEIVIDDEDQDSFFRGYEIGTMQLIIESRIAGSDVCTKLLAQFWKGWGKKQ